jgi:hypothetical protein
MVFITINGSYMYNIFPIMVFIIINGSYMYNIFPNGKYIIHVRSIYITTQLLEISTFDIFSETTRPILAKLGSRLCLAVPLPIKDVS